MIDEVSPAVTLTTNLFTNPSFETASGTVEVRRNATPNPRFIGTGWWASGIGMTYEGEGVFSSTSWNGSAAAYESSALTVVAGDIWSASRQVTVPVGSPALNLRLAIAYYPASAAFQGPTVTVSPGETVTLTVENFTIPASQTGIRSIIYGVTPPAGAKFVASQALVEKSPVARPYFDGGTSPDSDLSASWTAAVDGSASILVGVPVAAASPGVSVSIQSSQWSSSGAHSMRIISLLSTDGSAFVVVRTLTTADAGATFTAVSRMRITAPTVDATYARSFFLVTSAGNQQGPQIPNVPGEYDLRWTFTVPAGITSANLRIYNGGRMGDPDVWVDDLTIVEGVYTGPSFSGSTPPADGLVYIWAGTPDASVSYQLTPATYLPVADLTTQDVLYGSRTTSYRYELLTHNPDGSDSLGGYLDGVVPGASVTYQWNQAVKGAIDSLKVTDLDVAQAGMTRIADVNLLTMRLRPVLVIEGLPDIPLGSFLVTNSPEVWRDTGRTFELDMHDRTTALDQDQISQSFTADTTTPIMTQIANLIATAGELFHPDNSETRTLTEPVIWKTGTTKLQIVNDLLGALNYNALTIDGSGEFIATPYLRPALRTITYEVLNGITRELVDGDLSIYDPTWNRERDIYGVPTTVTAIATATGDAEPAQATYSNTDPSSPFSTVARGREIAVTIDGIDVPSDTDAVTFLTNVARASLIAQSSPQAIVTVKHLPLPINAGDVVRFVSTPAGIDERHVAVTVQLTLSATGLMQSSLQEVIDI